MKQGAYRIIFILSVVSTMFFSFWAIGMFAVYDEDNRLDLYSVNDAQSLKLADSVVSIFSDWRLEDFDESKDVSVYLNQYDEVVKTDPVTGIENRAPLCQGVKFKGQPKLGFCTGVLVAKDLILTAGHCVGPEDTSQTLESVCKSMRIKFGYAYKKSDKDSLKMIDHTQLYKCQEIVAYHDPQHLYQEMDYGLIRLNREVTDHEPIALESHLASINDPVVLMGHPNGLPLKVSDGAKIQAVNYPRDNFYKADVDAFQGNSGSPVFSKETGKIVGMVVSGTQDYDYDSENHCFKLATYTTTQIEGSVSTESVPVSAGETLMSSVFLSKILNEYQMKASQ
jgi:V8-like Glu-specific endopeptidase